MSISRRAFLAGTAATALGSSATAEFLSSAQASTGSTLQPSDDSGKPYNILMIVTDQERMLDTNALPPGYDLPGHQRLAQRGVVFENHQISSCVCTPSRAVIYTGQHIQNNGMFDNTNFSWSGSMSTEVDTIGDLLRAQDYYTAYKGKWHLTKEFETANDLHAPKKILVDEMEAYGFSDYFGIGDVIGHTEGGYLHDDVIAAGALSWLRGRGESLRTDGKPWFLSVNLINPHDVMYYNTDLPGETIQSGKELMHLNREPANALYKKRWDVSLPESRGESLSRAGRPAAHENFRNSRGVLCGSVPHKDDALARLNTYYLNCLRDVDAKLVKILDELDDLGLADNTIIVFTSDHGELGGAHGLTGKGATAYREQNNVPLTIVHPGHPGGKRCQAVTSHVDIAATLVSVAGGNSEAIDPLPGRDISPLLRDPEAAKVDTLRDGALFNYNMIGFVDDAFFMGIANYLAEGGNPKELPNQGFRPDLSKRGAIRSICDGRYKFNRYFSPLQHHMPRTMEQLLAYNDLELFDLVNDPLEQRNLATDTKAHGELIVALNDKLNALIESEVGDDIGQMLPLIKGQSWRIDPSFTELRY